MLLKPKNYETFSSISMLISKTVTFLTEQKSRGSSLRAITESGKSLSQNYRYGILLLFSYRKMTYPTEIGRSCRIDEWPLVGHQSPIIYGYHWSFFNHWQAWQPCNMQPAACILPCIRGTFRTLFGWTFCGGIKGAWHHTEGMHTSVNYYRPSCQFFYVDQHNHTG